MGTLPGVNFGVVGVAILKWGNKILKCRGRGPVNAAGPVVQVKMHRLML